MEERISKSKPLVTFFKFVLFILLFCFLLEMSRVFMRQVAMSAFFSLPVFVLSIFAPFAFYVFVADLNDAYAKIQNFFFRSEAAALYVPALLLVLGALYFALPRLAGMDFSRDLFVFSGGSVLATHFIFIARGTKGTTFSEFINYCFLFSVLYLINLILFTIYLRVAFDVRVFDVIGGGIHDGAMLIRDIVMRVFRF